VTAVEELFQYHRGALALCGVVFAVYAAVAWYARKRYRSRPDDNWFGTIQGVFCLGTVGATVFGVGLFLIVLGGRALGKDNVGLAYVDVTVFVVAGIVGGTVGGYVGWRLRQVFRANRAAYYAALPVLALVMWFLLT
jgi:hypothetical protein